MEIDFEKFKSEFLIWANYRLEQWAQELNVSKPPVFIIPEAALDPWEVGAVYVLPKWEHSGIAGPSIIFPENYLRDLYIKAIERKRIDHLWNALKWKLAHEMGHHVKLFNPQLAVSHNIPIVLVREAIRRGEITASINAYQLSEKTRHQHNLDFLSITGMWPGRYLALRLKEKRVHQASEVLL